MLKEDEPLVEQRVSFRINSDRGHFEIKHPDTGELICELSGYDMVPAFNFKYFKTVEDIQAAAGAISNLIIEGIMEEMAKAVNKT